MLVNATLPYQPKHSKPSIKTNWGFCALCQKDNDDPLECPARSTRKPVGAGYVSLARDILAFQDIGHMPLSIDIGRLDEGKGVECTMVSNNAKWHKSCRVMFNQTMLKRHVKENVPEISSLRKRSMEDKIEEAKLLCFFCLKPAGSQGLHEASTKPIDKNVRRCATLLNDTELLAKLSSADMIAQDAKYHRNCLRSLYNRARKAETNIEERSESSLEAIAFAELVGFIEEAHDDDDQAPVFKLSDLADMYKTRCLQLGASIEDRIHVTRLKNKLLSAIPGLEARKPTDKKNILLSFQEDVGNALEKACDHDSDALNLMRAAQVVRKELFNKKRQFDGSFHPECQTESVPPSLLALVNMIFDGTNIADQTQLMDSPTKTAALTIAQLLVFNSVKHARAGKSSGTVRHSRDRETPLPLYIALKIHGVTRMRGLIDTFFSLGLCVSYDRLLNLTSDIANSMCERFTVENLVCPPKLRQNLFTTAAADHLDYNPSSTTSKDSFHGTAISLIQHPSNQFTGLDRGVTVINQINSTTKSVSSLPDFYTTVPPVTFKTRQFTSPVNNVNAQLPEIQVLYTAEEEQKEWLAAVTAALKTKDLENDWVSWSAYFANKQQRIIPPPAIIGLLPLFLENSHSAAMIRHSMDMVKMAVQHLNPGQIPILAVDQPLYAIAKQIQWTWPSTHGEDKFVIMFGGLHIEMSILKVGP
jgi:hypothetical protein